MRKHGYRPERPGFIPEGQEHKWPAAGSGVECVGFVPEGWQAEQMLNGEYLAHLKKLAEAEKPAKKK